MGFDLLKPIDDVAKGALLGAVVDENYAHGSFVVGLRNCSEALLSSSVPHLQLDALVLHIDGLDLEVDSYMKEENKVVVSLTIG